MNIMNFTAKKQQKEKITLLTCYDYTSACIVEQSNVDAILVGDTVAMLMHGYPNTTHATVDMIATHTSAVSRGIKTKFLIADLPFLSYRQSLEKTMQHIQRLMQAGAQAIKLEGAPGNLSTIRHTVESGVPVMGHIGLTPQHIHQLGGHKVQGKKKDAQVQLLEQAQQLEEAGCFSIVLECVPNQLAQTITEALSIPTIGIGAGPATDGQILVYQDLLGMQTQIQPKFLKHFLQGESLILDSLNEYAREVKANHYPNSEVHGYST